MPVNLGSHGDLLNSVDHRGKGKKVQVAKETTSNVKTIPSERIGLHSRGHTRLFMGICPNHSLSPPHIPHTLRRQREDFPAHIPRERRSLEVVWEILHGPWVLLGGGAAATLHHAQGFHRAAVESESTTYTLKMTLRNDSGSLAEGPSKAQSQQGARESRSAGPNEGRREREKCVEQSNTHFLPQQEAYNPGTHVHVHTCSASLGHTHSTDTGQSPGVQEEMCWLSPVTCQPSPHWSRRCPSMSCGQVTRQGAHIPADVP